MTSKVRLAVFTAEAPWSMGESFVLTELAELQKRVESLIVIPVRPTTGLFHGAVAKRIALSAIRMPMISPGIAVSAIVTLALDPRRAFRAIWDVITGSRPLTVLLKNLAILPKALAVARILRRQRVTHIHAHWASVPATMALVVANVNGIPWSFTAHRWDIKERNLLRTKVTAAEFARAISSGGRDEIIAATGALESQRVVTVHIGTEVPLEPRRCFGSNKRRVTLGCIANLVAVKGHRYLIEACRLLRAHERELVCHLIGDGPQREELRALVMKAGLTNHVRFHGALSHEEVIRMLRSGDIDIVVLPSVETDTGEHEGIPVVLMEALAHRIPAIATASGRISELLGDGAGILVPPRNPVALADAVERVLDDKTAREAMIAKGFARVSKDFDVHVTAGQLLSLIEGLNTSSPPFEGHRAATGLDQQK